MMRTPWTFIVMTTAILALTCNAQEIWLPFGQICATPTQGICSPEHHLVCRNASDVERCWCPDGMYHDSSSRTVCVVEPNSTCIETPNFGWSTVCTPNAYCELTDPSDPDNVNGTCYCNQGSIHSGRYCKLSNDYGPCIHDNECARNVHLKCHSGKCSCDADGTDAEWSGTRTECLGLVGSPCYTESGNRNCTNGAECKVEDGSQACGCQDNNYLEHERRCFLNYGYDCSVEQCHPLFECHVTEANTTTCKCSTEYVDRNQKCTLKAGELCEAEPSSNETLFRDCSQDSSCIEDPNDQPNHRCLCEPGFSSLNDDVCLPTYDMPCDPDWGCNAALHFMCNNGTPSVCDCSLDYTWNDPKCIGEYGAADCDGDDECVTGFCDEDKKCGCHIGTDPYETPGSGTKCGGPEGHACSVDEVCRVDKFFQCLNGSCGCSEDKLSESEECRIKAERDCMISSGAACVFGSSCHLNRCTCLAGTVPNEEGRCVEAPPPPNRSTKVATFSVSMLVLFLSGTRFLA